MNFSWKFFAYARMDEPGRRENQGERERERRNPRNAILSWIISAIGHSFSRVSFPLTPSRLNLSRRGNGLPQFHPSRVRVIENKTGPLRMGPNKYRMYGLPCPETPIKILRIVSLLRRK